MGPTTHVQLTEEEGVKEVASGEVELLLAHHRVSVLHHNRPHIAAEATNCISVAQCKVALVRHAQDKTTEVDASKNEACQGSKHD